MLATGALRGREDVACTQAPTKPATEAERWIVTRLHQTLADVEQHFASYRFDLLAQALYEFVWNEYCDWFLELSKPALNGDDPDACLRATRLALEITEELTGKVLSPTCRCSENGAATAMLRL